MLGVRFALGASLLATVLLAGCDCFATSSVRWHDPRLYADVTAEAALSPYPFVVPPPDMPIQDADLDRAWGSYALRNLWAGRESVAGHEVELVGREVILRFPREDGLEVGREAAAARLSALGVAADDQPALFEDLRQNRTHWIQGTCMGCPPQREAYVFTALLPAKAVGAQAAWDRLREDAVRSPDQDQELGHATLTAEDWKFRFAIPVKEAQTPARAWLRVDADGQADLLVDSFRKEDGGRKELMAWAIHELQDAGWATPRVEDMDAEVSPC